MGSCGDETIYIYIYTVGVYSGAPRRSSIDIDCDRERSDPFGIARLIEAD